MKVGRCGTLTGREWHAARGEPTCPVCRAAYTAWQDKYRKRVYLEGPMLIPAIGTRRRIQALAWMGWNYRAIGEQIGVAHERSVGNILARELVHRDTAARIGDVYDRLCHVSGPSIVTASRARTRGWASWAEWDDIDDPDEIPCGVIERAHEEALEEARQRHVNELRRKSRSRRRINAQNYQRRKQRAEVAA